MGVDTRHPDYLAHSTEWEQLRDALNDEVKSAGVRYLPMTDGMAHLRTQNLNLADSIYMSYKQRAQYPLWVKDALRSMMGLVSRVTPEIQLPARMADFEYNATSDNFSLRQLFQRCVRETLITGRLPLLVDIDDQGKPYIAVYNAESGINWKTADIGGRQDLSLSVFTEQHSTPGNDEYGHETETRYRVLDLVDGEYRSRLLNDAGEMIGDEYLPRDARGQRIRYIPVVYCGSTDNAPPVDEVPLLTMARAAIKSYQLSADYYEALYRTAHPQAWAACNEEVDFTVSGPATLWKMGENGKVGYLEISGNGIEATRKAMDDQRNAALEAGARVIDIGGVESGEARKARQNDSHATLASIVQTVASALQQCCEIAAEITGNDPREVSFTTKPEFVNSIVEPQMVQQLLSAATAGLISTESFWSYLSTGKVPERSWDDEEVLIESQPPGGE